MIVLREINKKEYEEVKSILKEENIEDDLSKGIIYILINNGILIGAGKIDIENNYWVLKYIIVKKDHRGSNFGDSILRSILFKAESINIEKIFFYNRNEYLLKKGFVYDEEKYIEPYRLSLNVKDFFNRGCCGDENEI